MNQHNSIPFLDLVTPHQQLREELCGVFHSAIGNAGFIGGPMVESFERDFAGYCDVAECAGVGSGTDALRFALIAAGVGRGEVVVTVPNTFIATTEAISQAGATPVFVDVDELTCNMDPVKLREYLETGCSVDAKSGKLIDRKRKQHVTAIVPVHLYGQMADMDAILELADRFHLVVIEDACQAHGASYFSKKESAWKRAGSMGRAAAFSFYPGKNLGACGEGGAVTTNDVDLARKVRMLRDHGQSRKYYHDMEGYNGRLDAIQAGILHVKLPYLDAWNAQRRTSAQRYREMFETAGGSVELPFEPPWAKGVYHLYVVRVSERAWLQRELETEKIGTGIHYPIPLHLQKAYAGLGYRTGDFPVAEGTARRILSLPMYPGLAHEQQEKVVERTLHFVSRRADAAVAAGN